MDTRCLKSEINFQLSSYTRNVKFPPKWGFLLLPLGYLYHGCMGRAPGTEPNRVVNSKLLDHARELAVREKHLCNPPISSYVARP